MDKEHEEHEEHKDLSSKTVLHIFPTHKHDRIVTEHYVPPELLRPPRRRRYRRFKKKVKRFARKYKITFRHRPRKHPPSTQEHTEFDRYPYKMTCPNCLSYIKTDTFYYNTGVTHAVAASLSPICMCVVPYLIGKFKNMAHYCPNCQIYLGTKFGSGRDVFSCFTEPRNDNTEL